MEGARVFRWWCRDSGRTVWHRPDLEAMNESSELELRLPASLHTFLDSLKNNVRIRHAQIGFEQRIDDERFQPRRTDAA